MKNGGETTDNRQAMQSHLTGDSGLGTKSMKYNSEKLERSKNNMNLTKTKKIYCMILTFCQNKIHIIFVLFSLLQYSVPACMNQT